MAGRKVTTCKFSCLARYKISNVTHHNATLSPLDLTKLTSNCQTLSKIDTRFYCWHADMVLKFRTVRSPNTRNESPSVSYVAMSESNCVCVMQTVILTHIHCKHNEETQYLAANRHTTAS
eukprot:1766527-Amphidinium_carterae.1